MKGQAETGGEEKAPPIPLKKKTGKWGLGSLSPSLSLRSPFYTLSFLNSFILHLPSLPLSLSNIMFSPSVALSCFILSSYLSSSISSSPTIHAV